MATLLTLKTYTHSTTKEHKINTIKQFSELQEVQGDKLKPSKTLNRASESDVLISGPTMNLKTPKTRAYESIGPSPDLTGQSSDFEKFFCDIDKLAAPKRRMLIDSQPQNQSHSMKSPIDHNADECHDALIQIAEEEELKTSDDEEEETQSQNAVCKDCEELRISDSSGSDSSVSESSVSDEELRVSDSEDDVS